MTSLLLMGLSMFVSAQAAMVSPGSLTVKSGSISGQPISVLAVQDQSGTSDGWSKYKEFYATNSKVAVDFKFTMPVGDMPLTLKTNFKGPAKSAQTWVFQILQISTNTFITVGDNSSATSWRWSTLSFALPANPSQFVGSDGKVTVRYSSLTTGDDSDLDYLAIETSAGLPAPAPAPTSGINLPPAGKISWDWQIGAASESNIVVPAGAVLMDVDLFSTSAAKVAELKSKGIYTVCYINAGSYQPGLPDSNQYPSYLKLQADPNWPGEYFLDVTDVFKTDSVLAKILHARLQLCKDKGFDAVEPDNLQNDENIVGGLISTAQQIDFNGWFADAAHSHGLAAFQKNGPDKILLKDRTGRMMVDKFDGILNEECQQYNECQPLAEYVKRGKLALNVEYTQAPNCTLSSQLNINTIRKDLNLVGGNMSGYQRLTCN